jgi:uncharacterized protein
VESVAVAVSDTGPLIALHAVGLLGVLAVRFREVLIPLTVWSELNALPGAPEPRAVASLPRVRLVPDVEVPPSLVNLDPGEQQALAIGLTSAGSWVLLDDGAARRVARDLQLNHIGTVGLIAAARGAGLCQSARERYEMLLKTRFRIDLGVVNDVLRELGEDELPL